MKMGLTKAELQKNPQLCDAIVSYHLMPGERVRAHSTHNAHGMRAQCTFDDATTDG